MRYEYKGTPISFRAEGNHNILAAIAGITERELYWEFQKCLNACKAAAEWIGDYYKDYVRTDNWKFSAAPFSYGHLASIGARMKYTDYGEPNVLPFASDIDEAIAIMKEKKGVDFADNDLCRHYMDTNRYIKEVCPDRASPILAGYGRQGVITTAVLMRGQDFLMDMYDEPEKVHEFLTLLTDSIVDFDKFVCRMHGEPEVSPYGGLIADDFAALISPSMWPEFVVPYWNRFFEARTTAQNRHVHCEDMRVPHLKYLKDAKVTSYQPSVSEHLTIESIKKEIDIPFDWLLYSWKIMKMSDEEIQKWVDETVEGGVTVVRTQYDAHTWEQNAMDRIAAFFRAFDKYRVE